MSPEPTHWEDSTVSKCLVKLMDDDGYINLRHKTMVSPSICIVWLLLHGVDSLVCYMQDDCAEIVQGVVKCEQWLAVLVAAGIMDAYRAVNNVGSFYNDAVKRLMQRLMMLALYPYWMEMRE